MNSRNSQYLEDKILDFISRDIKENKRVFLAALSKIKDKDYLNIYDSGSKNMYDTASTRILSRLVKNNEFGVEYARYFEDDNSLSVLIKRAPVAGKSISLCSALLVNIDLESKKIKSKAYFKVTDNKIYEDKKFLYGDFIVTSTKDNYGLISLKGDIIINPSYGDYKVYYKDGSRKNLPVFVFISEEREVFLFDAQSRTKKSFSVNGLYRLSAYTLGEGKAQYTGGMFYYDKKDGKIFLLNYDTMSFENIANVRPGDDYASYYSYYNVYLFDNYILIKDSIHNCYLIDRNSKEVLFQDNIASFALINDGRQRIFYIKDYINIIYEYDIKEKIEKKITSTEGPYDYLSLSSLNNNALSVSTPRGEVVFDLSGKKIYPLDDSFVKNIFYDRYDTVGQKYVLLQLIRHKKSGNDEYVIVDKNFKTVFSPGKYRFVDIYKDSIVVFEDNDHNIYFRLLDTGEEKNLGKGSYIRGSGTCLDKFYLWYDSPEKDGLVLIDEYGKKVLDKPYEKIFVLDDAIFTIDRENSISLYEPVSREFYKDIGTEQTAISSINKIWDDTYLCSSVNNYYHSIINTREKNLTLIEGRDDFYYHDFKALEDNGSIAIHDSIISLLKNNKDNFSFYFNKRNNSLDTMILLSSMSKPKEERKIEKKGEELSI